MQLNRVQLVGVAILCFVAAVPVSTYLGEYAYGPLLDFVVSGDSDVKIVRFSVLPKGYMVFAYALLVLCVLVPASFWLVRGSPVALIARTGLLLCPMLAGIALYAFYRRYQVSRHAARSADLGIAGPPYLISADALHLEWSPLIGVILLALSLLILKRLSAQRTAEAPDDPESE